MTPFDVKSFIQRAFAHSLVSAVACRPRRPGNLRLRGLLAASFVALSLVAEPWQTPASSSFGFGLPFLAGLQVSQALAESGSSANNGQPNPAPNNLNSLCSSSVVNDPNSQGQLQSYCSAAQSSLATQKADGAIWKAWTVVAGVCAASCGGLFVGATACLGVDISASIFQGVEAHDLAGAFQNIMFAGMGLGAARAQDQAGRAAKTKRSKIAPASAEGESEAKSTASKSRDVGSCLSALQAIYNVYSNYQDEKNQASSYRSNLDQAKQLYSSSLTLNGSSSQLAATAGASRGGNNLLNPQGSPAGLSGLSAGNTNSGFSNSSAGLACAQVPTGQPGDPANSNAGLPATAQGAAILQCASAASNLLPNNLTSQPFADAFNSIANTSLGNFLGQPMSSPSQALTAAMGGDDLAPDAQAELSQTLDSIGQQATQDSANITPGSDSLGGTYQSGGGRSHSKHGAQGDFLDFGSLIGHMMKSLNPQHPSASVSAGIAAIQRAYNQNTTQEAIAANPTFSLFDRVSYRYLSKTLENALSPALTNTTNPPQPLPPPPSPRFAPYRKNHFFRGLADAPRPPAHRSHFPTASSRALALQPHRAIH